MAWAPLFALLSLLCAPYALGETVECYFCQMYYRGSGCITGSDKCIADIDKGQACLTIHFFYQEYEMYRMEGCTDAENCGKNLTDGEHSVQMTCCTDRDFCN